jgi:gliding motility-associated-like protein
MIIPEHEGIYWVTVLSIHGCPAVDSVYILFPPEEIPEIKLWIPNAFTPDGDGLNDTFKPVPSNDLISSFKMLIYNRWGEFLYETDDISYGWDGTTRGLRCGGDVYVYKIYWSAASVPGEAGEHIAAGTVTLLE